MIKEAIKNCKRLSGTHEGLWHSDDKVSDLMLDDERLVTEIIEKIDSLSSFRKKNKKLISVSTKKYAFENSISELKEVSKILFNSKLTSLIKE